MASARRPVQVAVFVGTRPEAIKLAPVVLEMRRRSNRFAPVLVSTSQHPEMIRQALAVFGLAADVTLRGPEAAALTARTADLLTSISAWFDHNTVDIALVQGDTSTAFSAALAAYYRGVPVGHVEAGLRTGHPRWPFPEEAHRRAIAGFARWSFCPTITASEHLRAEGIAAHQVIVTGNTVVDALQWIGARGAAVVPGPAGHLLARYRTMLVTTHRREHLDGALQAICRAVRQVVENDDTVACVFPVHPNPVVEALVAEALVGAPRVALCAPQAYDVLLSMLSACALVVTDSGGLQEEAPSFGKRVVVCRTHTERPEAIDAGISVLAGTREEDIVRACRAALAAPPLASRENPFGDGLAAGRICDVLERDWPAW